MDVKVLQVLLSDAWCQHLAAHTQHATMQDLVGMGHYLTTHASK